MIMARGPNPPISPSLSGSCELPHLSSTSRISRPRSVPVRLVLSCVSHISRFTLARLNPVLVVSVFRGSPSKATRSQASEWSIVNRHTHSVGQLWFGRFIGWALILHGVFYHRRLSRGSLRDARGACPRTRRSKTFRAETHRPAIRIVLVVGSQPDGNHSLSRTAALSSRPPLASGKSAQVRCLLAPMPFADELNRPKLQPSRHTMLLCALP